MGAGRQRSDELYIGFLLMLLSFLYLSHTLRQLPQESAPTVQLKQIANTEVQHG